MKTCNLFVLLLFACFTYPSHAQDLDRVKKADPIVWFGIDFTKAKFVNITETAEQVKEIMGPLNNLVISEPDKYNISKFFQKQMAVILLETEQQRNQAIDPSSLLTTKPIVLTREDIQEVVSGYAGASDKADTGLIFIVENCNKPDLSASVYVCFFDIKTGNILHLVKTEGKPRGFGLRNFWAGAIYQIMKNWKY